MKPNNVVISNPCNINWDTMTPNEMGKYCGACKKTVVDFSNMHPAAIQSYLESHQHTTVCGYFKHDQVTVRRPSHHQFLVNLHEKIERNFRVPFFQKTTLACLLLCMSIVGCNRPSAPKGEVTLPKKDSLPQEVKPSHKGKAIIQEEDTLQEPIYLGEVVPLKEK